jgi:hypothetical protein
MRLEAFIKSDPVGIFLALYNIIMKSWMMTVNIRGMQAAIGIGLARNSGPVRVTSPIEPVQSRIIDVESELTKTHISISPHRSVVGIGQLNSPERGVTYSPSTSSHHSPRLNYPQKSCGTLLNTSP